MDVNGNRPARKALVKLAAGRFKPEQKSYIRADVVRQDRQRRSPKVAP
jgi:hypothetical protein